MLQAETDAGNVKTATKHHHYSPNALISIQTVKSPPQNNQSLKFNPKCIKNPDFPPKTQLPCNWY